MKRAVGALLVCSLFKNTGSFASAGKRIQTGCLKHQDSAPALVPPHNNLNNQEGEKKTPQGSRGVFSYYGNHQLVDVAAHRMEDAKNAE